MGLAAGWGGMGLAAGCFGMGLAAGGFGMGLAAGGFGMGLAAGSFGMGFGMGFAMPLALLANAVWKRLLSCWRFHSQTASPSLCQPSASASPSQTAFKLGCLGPFLTLITLLTLFLIALTC